MVTYLLGAGASANAVPVVSGLYDSFKEFKDKLEEYRGKGFFNEIPDQPIMQGQKIKAAVVVEDLISACNESLEQIRYHQTFDTYAKRLTITGDLVKLRKLKFALTCYFYWIQSKALLDNRYDHFLASLIDHIDPSNPEDNFWPANINVLSWNYDLQFELSLMRYFPEKFDFKFMLALSRITTNYNPRPYKSENFLFKLNGTCLTKDFLQARCIIPNLIPNIDEGTIINSVYQAALPLHYNSNTASDIFKFAWESPLNDRNINASDLLKMRLEKTETLVVIGYSFPFFNREIDRTILGSMYTLNNIYIQAPESSVKQISDRLKSILDKMPNGSSLAPVLVTDKNQFFLPPEL